MILRYGQTWGQGTPDIKKDAMLDIRELLDYEVVKIYNTTVEDLEQVLIESVEYEEDGTEKKRFRPRREAYRHGLCPRARRCRARASQ